MKSRKEKKAHFSLVMPDGNMLGVWVYQGEDTRTKLTGFMDNWFRVTSKDPKMYGHKIAKNKCPHCGGEVHYKNHRYWCVKCHKRLGA